MAPQTGLREPAIKPAYLGAPNVSHPEHELQDAVPAGNSGLVRDSNGAATLLGQADPCKNDADGDGVQQHAKNGLHLHQPGDAPTRVGEGVAIPCSAGKGD